MRDSLEYNSSIPNVILDSDLGGDVDDMHDIATVVAYHKQGLINFIGYSLTGFGGAENLGTAYLRYSGLPQVQVWGPIGTGGYGPASLAEYNGGSYPATYLGTVAGFRKCLAAAPNQSVIILEVAPAGDLISLLQSSADIYSPLTGPQLVTAKVKYVIDAAGTFQTPVTFTCSSGSPGVLTVGTNILNGAAVILSVSGGSLPTGFTAGVMYYAVNSNGSTTIELSATPGGTPINTSSTGSGTMTATYSGGGYEMNFAGNGWGTLAPLWPASVPYIFTGIEQSPYIGTNAPPILTSFAGNPFACTWNAALSFGTRQGYSFPGLMYGCNDLTQGKPFRLGGVNGTVTTGTPTSGQTWVQSPSGPFSYLVGNPSAISGADSAIADAASRLRSALVATLVTPQIGNDPPSNISMPTVTGTAQVGQTLTGTQGTWNLATSIGYQWIWNDTSANISGATSSTYSPVSGDVGHTLALKVTATNSGGTLSETSTATAAVIADYTLSGAFTFHPTGPVNLTTQGTTDWIAFSHTSATSVSRKATGGSQLSVLTGLTGPSWNNQNSTGLTWTDGASGDTSATDELYYSFVDGTLSFTAPAGTSSHTLYVYVGQYNCPTSFTAHLSDSSSPDYVSTASTGGGWNAGLFVLTYHAATDGQTLNISFGSTNSQPAYIAGAALV